MEPETNSSGSISLQEYVAILRRRRAVILNTAVLIAVVGLIVTLMTKPVYRATTRLLVEGQSYTVNTVDTANPLSALFALNQQQTVDTQVEELQAQPLMDEVYKTVGKCDLFVNQVKQTQVIEISAEANDPRVAANAPTALVDAYLSLDEGQSTESIVKAQKFVASQGAIAQQKLQNAEDALKQFKQQTQVVELLRSRDAQIDRTNQLMAELQRIATVGAGLRSQVSVNQKLLAEEPQAIVTDLQATNIVKYQLREDIRKLQVQRDGLTQPGGFTEKASQVRSVDAQIAKLQAQLAAEPDLIVTKSSTPNQVREQLRAKTEDLQSQAKAAETQAAQTRLALAQVQKQAQKFAGWEERLGQLIRAQQAAANDDRIFTAKATELQLREKAVHRNARIIERAQMPKKPVRPKKLISILFSCLIGVFVGICLALLQEFLDDRINTPEDSERVLGLPSLGRVPALSMDDARLLPQMQGLTPASESYRVLRTNIHFASVDAPLRTLLVTSSSPGEGKTTTSVNLAFAMALDGKRVILVDTDLRRPSLHKILEIPSVPGLTDLLLEDASIDDVLLEHTEMPGLSVITAGSLPPNPGELLGSRKFRMLVDQLAERADLVIFDSPPVLAAADAPILASQLDGVVLVVETGGTKKSVARQSVSLLRQARANILGIAYNKMKAQDGSGYYYYQYSTPALTEDKKSRRNGKALPAAVTSVENEED